MREAELDRHRLTDWQWDRIKHLVAGKSGDRGRTGTDNRRFVEAVLWLARTGATWRELPPQFGKWNSVFRRFSRWAKRGVWDRVWNALAQDPDFEPVVLNAAIGRTDRHAAPERSGNRLGRHRF
jgi:transposase